MSQNDHNNGRHKKAGSRTTYIDWVALGSAMYVGFHTPDIELSAMETVATGATILTGSFLSAHLGHKAGRIGVNTLDSIGKGGTGAISSVACIFALTAASSLYGGDFAKQQVLDLFTDDDDMPAEHQNNTSANERDNQAIRALGADRARNPETGKHYRFVMPTPA